MLRNDNLMDTLNLDNGPLRYERRADIIGYLIVGSADLAIIIMICIGVVTGTIKFNNWNWVIPFSMVFIVFFVAVPLFIRSSDKLYKTFQVFKFDNYAICFVQQSKKTYRIYDKGKQLILKSNGKIKIRPTSDNDFYYQYALLYDIKNITIIKQEDKQIIAERNDIPREGRNSNDKIRYKYNQEKKQLKFFIKIYKGASRVAGRGNGESFFRRSFIVNPIQRVVFPQVFIDVYKKNNIELPTQDYAIKVSKEEQKYNKV
jgi:hypothetical protein